MLAATFLLGGAVPVAAQTAPTTSSTTTTPSTALVLPASPLTTTTVPAPTTSTAPASWAALVPGPPAPVPAPPTASAADIARAGQLARQIATQSNVLDVLAEQYDQAQQQVIAAAASLDAVRGRLAAARADAATAQAKVSEGRQKLRDVAVDAYVGLGGAPASSADAALRTYEQGAAQIGAETAVGKAMGQLDALHQVEQQLRATETAIALEEQQASDATTAAQKAAAQAEAAAKAAAVQQRQLLLTLSQAGGNLAPLVAAAQAAAAQAAFTRFETAGTLDFKPGSALAAPSPAAATAVQVAESEVGKPYVWGAAGPDTFDCSGLVLWAWGHAGVGVPRVAADQQAWATPVPISKLAPGDLVFFGTPAHHVGIYVGGGLMVDAPHSGANVSVVPIWWDDLAGFGRVHAP